MKKTTLYLTLLLLLIAGTLNGCDLIDSWRLVGPEGPTSFNLGGVDVTPLEVERDDTARILDIQQWKFNVRPLAEGMSLHYQLEFQRPGQPVLELANFELMDPGSGETMVALYALDDALFSAEKVKVFIGTETSTSSSVVPNPFAGYSMSSPALPAEIRPDGSFLLLEMSESGDIPADENAVLVFRVGPGGR